MSKPDNKTKFEDGQYYRLGPKTTDEVIAYFYYNPDAEEWGFGFNIADGGGFLPAFDLSTAMVEKVNLVTA